MYINTEKYWISSPGLSREFVNQFVEDIKIFNNLNKNDCSCSVDLLCYNFTDSDSNKSCPILTPVKSTEQDNDISDATYHLIFNRLNEFSDRCDWYIEMLDIANWKLILRENSECILNKI